MARVKKEFVVPKSQGTCADLLYTTRTDRLAISRSAKELEAREKAIKDYLIDTVSKDSAGVFGKIAKAVIESEDVPVVEDWPKLYAFIKKNNAFHLLGREVLRTAAREYWDAGKTIPGVKPFTVKKVSVTKI